MWVCRGPQAVGHAGVECAGVVQGLAVGGLCGFGGVALPGKCNVDAPFFVETAALHPCSDHCL